MKNPEFHADYKIFMYDIIAKAYAEKMPADSQCNKGEVWYIPHHGVYHPKKKKKKIRVVFDCTLTYQGVSLNNQLLQGPDLTKRKSCALLMAKSRVAPYKKITVPRMELTAAVIAVKVDILLKQELENPLGESVFWTDSLTVLRYVENDASRFKAFVTNSVALIREATSPSQWRYVNSSLNPNLPTGRDYIHLITDTVCM